MTTPETTFVAVDGRDALAYVILRPGENNTVRAEAAARGMGKPEAAYHLRHIADLWDPPAVTS